jgi:hypothetical protein
MKTMMKRIMMIVRGQAKIVDVWHYFVGNYRYNFYYGGKLSRKYTFIAWLRKRILRRHIKEQIAWRISIMNTECYVKGACIKCGCDTTQLQMANKPCEGNCYPAMMGKFDWKLFKAINFIKIDSRYV